MPTPASVQCRVPLEGVFDPAVLGAISDINEQFLLAMCRAARGRAPALSTPLLAGLQSHWVNLCQEDCRRLAACPYLLLDAGFSRPEPWLASLTTIGVREQPPAGGGFADVIEVALWREVLMLAWHLARSNRLAARVLLQLSPALCELLARARWQDLRFWVENRPRWLRPRWEDRQLIWQQLFRAAAERRTERLTPLQQRGVQLLAVGAVYANF